MRFMRAGVLIAAVAWGGLAASPGRAQDRSAIERCHNLQSTMEIVDCLGEVGVQADKHLNAAYQKALKGIDPKGVPLLRASERAWLEYRDKRCGYVSAGEGTIMRILAADCTVTMTKARADELDGDAMGLAGPG